MGTLGEAVISNWMVKVESDHRFRPGDRLVSSNTRSSFVPNTTYLIPLAKPTFRNVSTPITQIAVIHRLLFPTRFPCFESIELVLWAVYF